MALNPAEVAHGPMFIGFTLNVLLYGVMLAQGYIYFTAEKQDKTWMKAFVIFLLVADTANTVFDFAYLYRTLIVHFGDVEVLATADWLFATDPAITGIIASAVQAFFAWRVRVLTRAAPLAGAVSAGALAGLAGALATAFEVARTPRFTEFRRFKGVVIVWLAAESATDVLITGALVWYLQQHKTGFRASDAMVDRVIRLTMQTGLVTALAATLDLALFLIYPNGMHLIFNFPLCKLYTNSLMSSLNARAGWRYAAATAGAKGDESAAGTGTGTGMLELELGAGGLEEAGRAAGHGHGHRRVMSAVHHPRFGRRSGEEAHTHARSRSLGAVQGVVAALARPVGAARRAHDAALPAEVYVHVESCRRRDAPAAGLAPVPRADNGRRLSVCAESVGTSEGESKCASVSVSVSEEGDRGT